MKKTKQIINDFQGSVQQEWDMPKNLEELRQCALDFHELLKDNPWFISVGATLLNKKTHYVVTVREKNFQLLDAIPKKYFGIPVMVYEAVLK